MLVYVEAITKSYGSLTLFEELSMKIPTGHKIGLVGDNGSGKSSLFKLIIGCEPVSKGVIIRKKGLTIGYLEQLPQVSDGITVQAVIEATFKELIQLGQELKRIEQEMASSNQEELIDRYGRLQEQFIQFGGYELEFRIEKMTSGLGIHHLLNQPFNQLSGGEQTKVGLVQVLLQEPTLLLLDEPTNHLDLKSIEWLESYLKDYQGTMVVISHDRRFLDEVVTEIYELEDNQIQVYQGNYSVYVELKKQHLAQEMLNFQEQQKKIKKLETAIRRYRQWGNESGNEDMFKKAKNMEKRLARIEQLKHPIMEKDQIKLKLAVAERSGKKVVRIENMTKCYGSKVLFKNMDFQLLWSKHVGVVGENGVGKSTLINLILKNSQPDSGKVELGEQVKIGYLPQKVEFRDENLSILETFRIEVGMEEGEARHFLARFLFYSYEVFRLVKNLSGGERMRLKLAILMKQDTNFLVLDEPTNHLDISTREVVEEVLMGYSGTILAVSHDRYFLDKLFSEILWLTSKNATVYPGDFQWAREKQLANEEQLLEESKVSQKLKKKRTTKKALVPTIADIELEIEQATIEFNQIEQKLNNETEFVILADLVDRKSVV